MSVRLPVLVAMALGAAACSSASSTGAAAPPAPAAAPAPSGPVANATPAPAPAPAPRVRNIDPTGMYDVNITAQGNPMAINAVIEKKADGTWGGTVTGDAIPPLPIRSVTVTGNSVKLVVTAPDGGDAFITMVVDGTDISGDWSMAGDGSKITGKKRAK
ncbi:MAG: hypothetical protein HY084_10440 [Gemmatimonadetes bacterium]|nr:hypothetical protein [Gemmatimonadota bacterium]